MLEMINRLNAAIMESEEFWGYLDIKVFEDGVRKTTLTHMDFTYRHNNDSITYYNFDSEEDMKEFESMALECIKNGTLLEDLR